MRNALVFSALTKQPVQITNIRAGRKKGGLASQHLKGLELVKELCRAQVTGAHIGSMDVEFVPGNLIGGHYTADAVTAGFVSQTFPMTMSEFHWNPFPGVLHCCFKWLSH